MVSFEEVEECLEEMTYNKKIKKEESAIGILLFKIKNIKRSRSHYIFIM